MRVALAVAGAVAALAAAPSLARVPGSHSLLVVGDSLTVGTEPYIDNFLPRFHIHQRVAISTQAGQGPSIVSSYGSRLPRVVFVNLGTNGDPRATSYFLSSIRRIMRIAGPHRCVVWATIVRPPVGGVSYHGLNSILREQAGKRRNLILFRWAHLARLHPGWFGSDHVHVTGAAYKIRARAMAARIRTCRKLTLPPRR